MAVFVPSRFRRLAGLAVLSPALLLPARPAAAQETPAPAPMPAAPAVAPPPAPARSVTLEQAIALAQEASPVLIRAEGNARSAASSKRTALAAFLPSVSADANSLQASAISPVSQPGVSVADGSSAFGLSASWDVFTAGRRGAERKRADAAADASELQLVDQRFSVTVDAQQSYFNVLRNTDLVRVAQARVQRAQDGLNQAKNRHDAGTATLSDELRAQIELSTAQQALLGSIADLQVSYYALGRTIGSDEPVGAQAPAALETRPLSMSNDEVMKLIVEQSPSVRAADATARAAGTAIAVAHAKYLPSLQLTGAWRWADVATTPQFRQPGIWDLRLGMSFPIFDNLQREDAVVRAHASADAASADASDRRRAARVAAERALTAFDLASQRISLAETTLQAAQEDLRVQDARYRAGASTILDRVTSQANLASAEATLVTVWDPLESTCRHASLSIL